MQIRTLDMQKKCTLPLGTETVEQRQDGSECGVGGIAGLALVDVVGLVPVAEEVVAQAGCVALQQPMVQEVACQVGPRQPDGVTARVALPFRQQLPQLV